MVSSDLQKSELTAILKSCRRLSNILEIEELYTVFADLVKDRFAVRKLAIFMYDKADRKLSLVSSTGLGDIRLVIPESSSGV